MKHTEFILQRQVCTYLRLQYPNVLFSSDFVSHLKLTNEQKTRNASIQKRGFHAPDLTIFSPRGGYHALFIELKTKTPFKKDGTLLQNKHLENQEGTIKKLRDIGYFVDFKWTLEDAIKLIDWYLKLDANEV